MRFYRVSHASKRNAYESDFYAGPYNGHGLESDELDAMGWRHGDAVHPPFTIDCFGPTYDVPCEAYYPFNDDESPEHDCYVNGCVKNPADYVCGFESEEMLREWFSGYRAMLRREGFVLRVYDVPDAAVQRGRYQAACRRDALRADNVSVRVIP